VNPFSVFNNTLQTRKSGWRRKAARKVVVGSVVGALGGAVGRRRLGGGVLEDVDAVMLGPKRKSKPFTKR